MDNVDAREAFQRVLDQHNARKRPSRGTHLITMGAYRVEIRPERSNSRIFIWKRWRRGLLGEFYIRFTERDFTDKENGVLFDVVTLSNIWVTPKLKRQGIGTMVVKMLASKYPNALIEGQNPSAEAILWHRNRLERLFPSRMLSIGIDLPTRVTPGAPIDPTELL